MYNQKSCKPDASNAGNYYSWPAATAGGKLSSGDEISSICPKGWQLTVNATSEVKSWYYLIRNTYSISDSYYSKLRPLPLSFICSGSYYQAAPYNRGILGNYESSSAYSSSNMYYLLFNFGELNPSHNYAYGKNIGMSVRCVAR